MIRIYMYTCISGLAAKKVTSVKAAANTETENKTESVEEKVRIHVCTCTCTCMYCTLICTCTCMYCTLICTCTCVHKIFMVGPDKAVIHGQLFRAY